MDYYNIYKELYYKEDERRSRLSDKMASSTTIFIALVTAQIWVITIGLNRNYETFGLEMASNILLIICSLFVPFVAFYFCVTYFSYEYSCVSPERIKDFQNALELVKDDYSDKEIELYENSCISDLYYECAKSNQEENNRRAKMQHRLFVSFAIFLFVLIAEFCWFMFLEFWIEGLLIII